MKNNFDLKYKNKLLLAKVEIAKTIRIAKTYDMSNNKIRNLIEDRFGVRPNDDQIYKLLNLDFEIFKAKQNCTDSIN